MFPTCNLFLETIRISQVLAIPLRLLYVCLFCQNSTLSLALQSVQWPSMNNCIVRINLSRLIRPQDQVILAKSYLLFSLYCNIHSTYPHKSVFIPLFNSHCLLRAYHWSGRSVLGSFEERTAAYDQFIATSQQRYVFNVTATVPRII